MTVPKPIAGILKKCIELDSSGPSVDLMANVVPDSLSDAVPESSNSQCSSGELEIQNSNSNSLSSVGHRSFMMIEVVNRVRRLGGCTRCFSLNHICFDCISAPRCSAYFKIGHKFKACLMRSQPRLLWRPKSSQQYERPRVENEEPVANSISPPIPSEGEEENPTPCATSHPSSKASAPLHPVFSVHPSSEDDQVKEDMANFAVDPAPFVPHGLEVEDWVRPARGRIIVGGNTPCRHEEYAIVTLLPPPQQNHLYDAMEEEVAYFEEE